MTKTEPNEYTTKNRDFLFVTSYKLISNTQDVDKMNLDFRFKHEQEIKLFTCGGMYRLIDA